MLEAVIAIAAAVIIAGALVFATIATLRNAQFAKNQTQATKLAQEAIEKVRDIRDRNEKGETLYLLDDSPPVYTEYFSDLWGIPLKCDGPNPNCFFIFYFFDGKDHLGSTIFANIFEEIGSFKRQIMIEDACPGGICFGEAQEKRVTAIVVWTDFAGSHQSKISTILRKI